MRTRYKNYVNPFFFSYANHNYRHPLASMLFRSLALLPLAVGGIAAEAVNFDGHQAFRVMTDGDAASVSKKLGEISHNRWSMGAKDHIDISISGDDVEHFKKMGLKFKEMHKDLGKDIREEKNWKPYKGEQRL